MSGGQTMRDALIGLVVVGLLLGAAAFQYVWEDRDEARAAEEPIPEPVDRGAFREPANALARFDAFVLGNHSLDACDGAGVADALEWGGHRNALWRFIDACTGPYHDQARQLAARAHANGTANATWATLHAEATDALRHARVALDRVHGDGRIGDVVDAQVAALVADQYAWGRTVLPGAATSGFEAYREDGNVEALEGAYLNALAAEQRGTWAAEVADAYPWAGPPACAPADVDAVAARVTGKVADVVAIAEADAPFPDGEPVSSTILDWLAPNVAEAEARGWWTVLLAMEMHADLYRAYYAEVEAGTALNRSEARDAVAAFFEDGRTIMGDWIAPKDFEEDVRAHAEPWAPEGSRARLAAALDAVTWTFGELACEA